MRIRLIFALICLLSLIVELSFDNTNPFVRVSPEVMPIFSVSQDIGHEQSVTVNHSGHFVKSAHSKEKIPYGKSIGHSASAVSDFIYVILEEVHRLDQSDTWHYRYIDRFALLRPPISS